MALYSFADVAIDPRSASNDGDRGTGMLAHAGSLGAGIAAHFLSLASTRALALLPPVSPATPHGLSDSSPAPRADKSVAANVNSAGQSQAKLRRGLRWRRGVGQHEAPTPTPTPTQVHANMEAGGRTDRMPWTPNWLWE